MKRVFILCVVLFQILILVNITLVNSYLLSEMNFSYSQNIVKEKENFIDLGIDFLVSFFSIKQIGSVSAYEEMCCPFTNDGKEWVNMDSMSSGCSVPLLYGTCESIAQKKCCPLTKEGDKCSYVEGQEDCEFPIESGFNCADDTCSSRFKCCTRTNDENICQDLYHIDYGNCVGDLISNSCNAINCRLLNTLPPPLEDIDLDLGFGCCPLTKDGAICQDVMNIDKESCAVDTIPTKCELHSDCKVGCCVDEVEGLCSTGSTKLQCEKNSGKWSDESSCSYEECQKGCCVIGEDTQFVTEKRCEHVSELIGYATDFRDIHSEPDCLALSKFQRKGACLLNEGACKFTTDAECVRIYGTFFENKLCSHPDLGSICKRQDSIACASNAEEVYWFDSCGNIENIYSSDKDFSWNGGSVLSKRDSCNPELDNIDSKDCGNCNYQLGGLCSAALPGESGVKDGDYVCKNMNCVDEQGKVRKNGESWCVYDSFIGDGKDVVGSRHWVATCVFGEVTTNGCADYRGQICTQYEMKEGNKTFTQAGCTTNEALKCFNYNFLDDKNEKCEENSQCIMKDVNLGASYNFQMCVGKYPLGSVINSDSPNLLCKSANNKCEILYKKSFIGEWECKENCACATEEFAKQMNDLCVSLSDCGSYVNYIGEGTNSVRVSGVSGISWQEYKKYSEPVKGQYANTSNYSEVAEMIINKRFDPNDLGHIQDVVDFTSKVSGAFGMVSQAAGFFYPELLMTPKFVNSYTGKAITVGPLKATLFGQIAGAAGAFAIGSAIASFVGNMLGLKGEGALAFSFGGGTISATVYLMYKGFLKAATWGPYALVVAVVLMIFIALVGWGETKVETVEFTCLPWEPPIGGDDCKKCNGNSLKPCTSYRCNSLGTACRLVNDNTENPTCESIPNDNSPPVISVKGVGEEYKFSEVSSNAIRITPSIGGCIPEFTQVSLELDTDEFAQCKFDFTRENLYDEMRGYPLEQNAFSINHTFPFAMPSPESLGVSDVAGDIRDKSWEYNIYIRCRDYHGNVNLNEFAVGFCVSDVDITAPVVLYFDPANESFLEYNKNETFLRIYLNEPSSCRIDSENKPYDEMVKDMECRTGLNDVEGYGWPCFSVLSGLNNDVNVFNIKCKDKPWLDENNKSRNVHSEGYNYALYGSGGELSIDSVSPRFTTIEAGSAPASVILNVETSGGSEDGRSRCYYGLGRGEENILFRSDVLESLEYHTQEFNTLMGGNYLFYIRCEDNAGNTDNTYTSFKLDIDTSPPKVTRIYEEYDGIRVITDEEAECYYDNYTCYFSLKNGTSMTTLLSTEHSLSKVPNERYHIKCRDVWGNVNVDCAEVIESKSFEVY